jgi:hypothetical protein
VRRLASTRYVASIGLESVRAANIVASRVAKIGMEATTRNSIRPNDRHRRERSIIETKYVSPRLGHKSHTAARREKSITPSLWGAKITSASETLNLYRIEQRYGKWLCRCPPASGHLTRRETLLPTGEMPPNRTRMEFWRPTGI